jgi:hypothetical protein
MYMVDKKPVAAAAPKSPADKNEAPRRPRRYMPNARECALLLLRLIQAKEEEVGRPLSRFRVAEVTLENISGRVRIRAEFIEEMNQWLFRAGRVLFFSGGSFGVIMTSAVENWTRLSSKRIASELIDVEAGGYDFSALEQLLSPRPGVDRDET